MRLTVITPGARADLWYVYNASSSTQETLGRLFWAAQDNTPQIKVFKGYDLYKFESELCEDNILIVNWDDSLWVKHKDFKYWEELL